jgi:uncharacterized coiled-coil protein SlyX
MQVSEEQRRVLYERLREHLDEETATRLLEVTVPANVEVATRSDLHEVRGEILLRLAELSEQFGARFAGLEDRIAGLEDRIGRLEGRIAGLENRIAGLENRIAGLEDRIGRLEASVMGLGTMLTDKLYKVVVPTLIATIALVVGFASWIGTAFG